MQVGPRRPVQGGPRERPRPEDGRGKTTRGAPTGGRARRDERAGGVTRSTVVGEMAEKACAMERWAAGEAWHRERLRCVIAF